MVTESNTTHRADREARLDRAIQTFKAEVQEYDPTILSFLVCRGGQNLNELECIVFNRSERLEERLRQEEGGAA